MQVQSYKTYLYKMNIIIGQNESLPNIRGQWEIVFDGIYSFGHTTKGCISMTQYSNGGSTSGSGTNKNAMKYINAQKTQDVDGKTIDNPAYKDPINGKPVEVKTKNFTYKNWIRKF